MGRKHSKNNNDRAFFSNAERKAAAYGRHASSMLGGHNTGANFREWGWGAETRTLDSDSMKDIDACSLSLQPCVLPLVSPSGVLYDKQVLIEYILSRKKEIERELKAWESQQASDTSTANAASAAAQQTRIQDFVAQQEGLSQADLRARAAAKGSGVVSAASMGRTLVADAGKHAADTSFWTVQNTPEAQRRAEKPDTVLRCPISNEPLRCSPAPPARYPTTLSRAAPSALIQPCARVCCQAQGDDAGRLHTCRRRRGARSADCQDGQRALHLPADEESAHQHQPSDCATSERHGRLVSRGARWL